MNSAIFRATGLILFAGLMATASGCATQHITYEKGPYVCDRIEAGDLHHQEQTASFQGLDSDATMCRFRLETVPFYVRRVIPQHKQVQVVTTKRYDPEPNELIADLIALPFVIVFCMSDYSWSGQTWATEKQDTGTIVDGPPRTDGTLALAGVPYANQAIAVALNGKPQDNVRSDNAGIAEIPAKRIADVFLTDGKALVRFGNGVAFDATCTLNPKSLELILHRAYRTGW